MLRRAVPEAPLAVDDAGSRLPPVSVVTPAFNQSTTIRRTIGEIIARLDATGLEFELIVVSDGSLDRTYDEALRVEDPRVRVIDYDRNLGKGFALRTGSLAARTAWVAWIDSDLDLDPRGVASFLRLARGRELDVVVGSKRHPRSEVAYPRRRRLYSWLYQMLVRALFRLDVRDTQVGLKLFRRDVLDEVLPVVLVKRYAFDLEVLAVARHFGFGRIEEHPIALSYRFTGSGVGWRAIANALWDTAAVFYRLRLLHFYDRRRVLADRVAAYRTAERPSLAVLTAPETLDRENAAWLSWLREALPRGTALTAVAERVDDDVRARPPHAAVVESGERRLTERLARGLGLADADVVAVLAPGARPSGGWAASALALFGDPTVGAVVGPSVPQLGGGLRADAAGILTESRLGVGRARIRHQVDRLREIDDFPLANVLVRRSLASDLLADGQAVDDGLCAAIRRRGMGVISSPDVMVTMRPTTLFRPYLRMIRGLGAERGARLRPRELLRLRYLAPLLLLATIAAGPLALLAGGPLGAVWLALFALYAVALVGFAGVTFALHRRAALAATVTGGAICSHVCFGAGLIGGVARRGRRAPVDSSAQPPARSRAATTGARN